MDRAAFDKDKIINPGQLDIEACRQAETFFKWAEQSVAARAAVDRCKFDLDVCEAKLKIAIREDPSKFEVVKVTEDAIAARARVDEKYVAAYTAYLEAKLESGLLDVAVNAMEQRKRMLEVLITLHGQEYFAGPSVPRSLVDEWKQYQGTREEAADEKQRAVVRKRVTRSTS